ncbi:MULTISPECIES: ABC transporter ATP-binding protein [unclassified Oceanispirochaeta]|uniref:ABC transporter ATP-binding protein n=1 Tax=unclassified Oceanispirochaeta TaxID=2635722 RepID=UPI000E09D0ED|nr:MULTISPECIES: ABC transporter ATP-binding protein [unclassified Oceanispirochaeta]MBF9016779.1 ABC transporter ATP-binding protein [Oceanispirochaeta sp. M2]NPD72049.1 ABC transporter ATP-binding protein [Oceanispirochaeta sp. M1]RDG32493.1 ABC transporter ATP-binding protein [Oceanispirochaeta sp. M1]
MISIKNLSKTYLSGDIAVHALKNISLEIDKGAFLAVAGPSGSGKTTLLNCIGCIDQADEGLITIENDRVSEMDKNGRTLFRRQNLGFIFQSYNLIPVLSSYENIALALQLNSNDKKEIDKKTREILKEVGLEGMENRRPNRLSGGQQQRVAVARALVDNPKLILADEPTANLDSHTGEAILDLMKEMNNRHGITFIFSTHDQMVMDRADRLIQLHDGEIQSDRRT